MSIDLNTLLPLLGAVGIAGVPKTLIEQAIEASKQVNISKIAGGPNPK